MFIAIVSYELNTKFYAKVSGSCAQKKNYYNLDFPRICEVKTARCT